MNWKTLLQLEPRLIHAQRLALATAWHVDAGGCLT